MITGWLPRPSCGNWVFVSMCPGVQSLVRIPETLLCAMEFITLYTPPEHNAPLDELRRLVMPYYPELMSKTNKTFWQRKVSCYC